jgi:predicted DNA-binding antitoxin AbrB/MazE fold protein
LNSGADQAAGRLSAFLAQWPAVGIICGINGNNDMTTCITAVFEGGLLRPTTPLELPEGTRVELIIRSEHANAKESRAAANILAEIAALPTAASELAKEHP